MYLDQIRYKVKVQFSSVQTPINSSAPFSRTDVIVILLLVFFFSFSTVPGQLQGVRAAGCAVTAGRLSWARRRTAGDCSRGARSTRRSASTVATFDPFLQLNSASSCVCVFAMDDGSCTRLMSSRRGAGTAGLAERAVGSLRAAVSGGAHSAIAQCECGSRPASMRDGQQQPTDEHGEQTAAAAQVAG